MPYKDADKQKESSAKHYAENTGKYRQSSKAYRERVFAKIASLKTGPCVDCEVSYPHYVMQWDHVRGNKVNSISNLATRGSWKAIEEEIAKCELVCGNCHAERTWQRGRA